MKKKNFPEQCLSAHAIDRVRIIIDDKHAVHFFLQQLNHKNNILSFFMIFFQKNISVVTKLKKYIFPKQ